MVEATQFCTRSGVAAQNWSHHLADTWIVRKDYQNIFEYNTCETYRVARKIGASLQPNNDFLNITNFGPMTSKRLHLNIIYS